MSEKPGDVHQLGKNLQIPNLHLHNTLNKKKRARWWLALSASQQGLKLQSANRTGSFWRRAWRTLVRGMSSPLGDLSATQMRVDRKITGERRRQ